MVLKYFILALSYILLSACSESETSSDSSEVKEESGKDLYRQYCVSCHGSDGSLEASGSKDLSLSNLESNEISEIILDGKNGMPQFKHVIISEEDVQKTVEYVESLRK